MEAALGQNLDDQWNFSLEIGGGVSGAGRGEGVGRTQGSEGRY